MIRRTVGTVTEPETPAGIAAEVPRAVDQVPGELRELFGWAGPGDARRGRR